MAANPLCPNCSREMSVSRTIEGDELNEEQHVFKCDSCHVTFITKDHEQVAGGLAG